MLLAYVQPWVNALVLLPVVAGAIIIALLVSAALRRVSSVRPAAQSDGGLLSAGELELFSKLKEAVPSAVAVHPKVAIEALRQKAGLGFVDFLLVDEETTKPLAAVQLPGTPGRLLSLDLPVLWLDADTHSDLLRDRIASVVGESRRAA